MNAAEMRFTNAALGHNEFSRDQKYQALTFLLASCAYSHVSPYGFTPKQEIQGLIYL